MRPWRKTRTSTVNGEPASPARFWERLRRRRLRRFPQSNERTLFNRSLSSLSFSFSQSGENEERLREQERAGSAFVPLMAAFRQQGVIIAAMIVLFAGGCTRREPAAVRQPAKTAASKVTLQTDWFPQGEHGGYYQALAKGFYAE